MDFVTELIILHRDINERIKLDFSQLEPVGFVTRLSLGSLSLLDQRLVEQALEASKENGGIVPEDISKEIVMKFAEIIKEDGFEDVDDNQMDDFEWVFNAEPPFHPRKDGTFRGLLFDPDDPTPWCIFVDVGEGA